MKTASTKPVQITHEWYIIDAEGQTLGRLASLVATYLQGKHKPYYVPHINCGDNVVVINAAKIHVTGNKLEDKMYYRHSGYPGGLTEINLADQLVKDPTRVIAHAVKGMLPKNRLSAERMLRLKIYPLADHSHAPQSPKVLKVPHGK